VDEVRDGITLTNLDQPLFDEAGATKRNLIDYLDAIANRFVPVLSGRPLSVIRVRPGQAPFMQKNKPKGAPDWLPTVTWWAESSQRDVSYVLCEERRTLVWFGNQRAVEYHPTLVRADLPDHVTHLVLDLDPPEGKAFADVVRVAHLARGVLRDCGMDGVAKTSGAKGIHIFVPIATDISLNDSAAALRALARRVELADPTIATTAFIKDDRAGKVFVDATRVGGATVAAAYSPRIRPGCPVSFPVAWSDLDSVAPTDFTIVTAPRVLGDRDPWSTLMPDVQQIPHDVIDEGHTIPVARVQAMHEGKRRAARARKM
jgi:bifunctional non-homologous end joining protein LigD